MTNKCERWLSQQTSKVPYLIHDLVFVHVDVSSVCRFRTFILKIFACVHIVHSVNARHANTKVKSPFFACQKGPPDRYGCKQMTRHLEMMWQCLWCFLKNHSAWFCSLSYFAFYGSAQHFLGKTSHLIKWKISIASVCWHLHPPKSVKFLLNAEKL